MVDGSLIQADPSAIGSEPISVWAVDRTVRMKASSRLARRAVLGAVVSAAVGSGLGALVAAQDAPTQVVTLKTSATVPRQCTVTISTRALDAAGSRPSGAVLTAVVAVCTRGSAQAITVHVSSPTPRCELLPIPGGSATACGGTPAADFVRALPGSPSSETKAYVSVLDGVSESGSAESAVAIEF